MYANILNLSQKEILTLKTLTSVEKRSDTTINIAVPNSRTTFGFIDKKARDTYFQELVNKSNAIPMDDVLAGTATVPAGDLYVLSLDGNLMINISFATNVTKMNHDSLVFRMEHRSYTFTFGSMLDRDKYFTTIVDFIGAQTIHDVIVKGLNVGFGPGGSPGSPGAQEFVDLDDTPASYSSYGGKLVKVNASEDGLEFGSPGAQSFADLDDTPDIYIGEGGKLVKVNASEDGLEFGSPDDESSGLERVGDGWRLIGRDPGNFGTPGIDSVDLSSSDGTLFHRGALGRHSLATGDNVLAAGDNSATVGGHTNEATGTNTVVVGGHDQAGGQDNMVYMHGTKYKGYTTSEMNSLESEKGTILFNTDLNRLVQCIDDNPKPNVWNVIAIDEGSPGMTFEELKDTPAGYAGEKGRIVLVKSTEDGLEFGSPGDAGILFRKLLDTPSGYAGEKGNIVLVKSTEDGLEFGSHSFTALSDTPTTYGSPGNSMVVNDLGTGLFEQPRARIDGDPDERFRVKDGVDPGDAVNWSQIKDIIGGLHYQDTWKPSTQSFPREDLIAEQTGYFWIISETGAGPGGSPGSPGSPGVSRMWYKGNWIVYNGLDATKNIAWKEYSEGIRKFLDMLDTPSSYKNEAGMVPMVNITEDGLVFTRIASSRIVQQVGHGFKLGDQVHSTKTGWGKSRANDESTLKQAMVSSVTDDDNFVIDYTGFIEIRGHLMTTGSKYYLSDTSPGVYTETRPPDGKYVQLVFEVIDADTIKIIDQAVTIKL